MNKIIFVYFLLVFGQCFALDKLDPETLKEISDTYDVQSFSNIKQIEQYFAYQQPEIFDDAIDLKPERGQMEQGYKLIMTPGKPLEVLGQWGTYRFNNCATVNFSEEEMASLIKKRFGAELTGYHFHDQTKSQVFSLSKFDGKALPQPVSRKPQQFVRPEEARHAFDVLSSKYEDEQAIEEFKKKYPKFEKDEELSECQEGVVKKWQPISHKNYKSVENIQPVYWVPSLGTLKSVLSSWYIWK
jgi:hypothetical protein